MKVNTSELFKLSKAVLAALRRANRIPVRLDEEDYEDLVSEGVLVCLEIIGKYDPARGSLGAYLSKPIQRAQLREAWKVAHVGLTGDCRNIKVWAIDDNEYSDEPEHAENLRHRRAGVTHEELPTEVDVAAEIEAFDYVWKTHYLRDST